MFSKALTPSVLLLSLLTACSSGSDSTSDADSLAMMADTTTVQDVFEEDINDEAHEAVDADTVLLTDTRSAFGGPQLNAKTAFVYRKGGLPIYKSLDDTSDSTKAVAVIDFGSRIALVDNLVNNQPSDKITIEGLKGRYVPFKNNDGTQMYIFSGYLTNFPMPKDLGLVTYCEKTFHLVGSPVKVTSKTMFDGTTPEWYKTKFTYESGIVLDDDGYYEGSSAEITLPASCTMQEGFLLLKAFDVMSDFDSTFYSYPPKDFTKRLDEYRAGRVESTDQDGVTKIVLEDNSGCVDETYVEKVDGRIVIGNGGGC